MTRNPQTGGAADAPTAAPPSAAPYATRQQIEERYGRELLLTLAPLPAADPPAVDETAVTRALADAAEEIDACLARKYALPLDPPPPLLARLAADIAVYRLAHTADALTDERRRRCDDALDLLRRIAAGEVSLGPAARPNARGSARLRCAPRLFRRRPPAHD